MTIDLPSGRSAFCRVEQEATATTPALLLESPENAKLYYIHNLMTHHPLLGIRIRGESDNTYLPSGRVRLSPIGLVREMVALCGSLYIEKDNGCDNIILLPGD